MHMRYICYIIHKIGLCIKGDMEINSFITVKIKEEKKEIIFSLDFTHVMGITIIVLRVINISSI